MPAESPVSRVLTVHTDDGVELAGIVVPAGPNAAPLTFVVAHGFTNSTARAPLRRLVGWLSAGQNPAAPHRSHARGGPLQRG